MLESSYGKWLAKNMKKYQKLAADYLRYYVVETIHTDEGRQAVEKDFRNIIKEARADVRREEKRNTLLNELCKRRIKRHENSRSN